MATFYTSSSNPNKKVKFCVNCHASYQTLLKDLELEKENHRTTRDEKLEYLYTLEEVEVEVEAKVHKENEEAWTDKYNQLEYQLKLSDWKLGCKISEVEKLTKERDDLLQKLASWNESSQTSESVKSESLSEKNDTLESPTQTDKIDRNNVIGEVVPEGFSRVKKKKSLKSVKFAEPLETKPVTSHKKSNTNPRKNNNSPRGNQRNWNGMLTQKLGKNFEFQNKACYVCGSFNHLQYTCKHKKPVSDQKQVWNNSRRVNHRNFSSDSKYPQQRRFFNPSAVLTKQGLKQIARPKVTRSVLSQSTDRLSQSTARPKESTARSNSEVNVVKASARWVWKPKQEELDVSEKKNSSKTLTRCDYVDAYGRFKSILAWDFKKH